jgi:hypothetical protein
VSEMNATPTVSATPRIIMWRHHLPNIGHLCARDSDHESLRPFERGGFKAEAAAYYPGKGTRAVVA